MSSPLSCPWFMTTVKPVKSSLVILLILLSNWSIEQKILLMPGHPFIVFLIWSRPRISHYVWEWMVVSFGHKGEWFKITKIPAYFAFICCRGFVTMWRMLDTSANLLFKIFHYFLLSPSSSSGTVDCFVSFVCTHSPYLFLGVFVPVPLQNVNFNVLSRSTFPVCSGSPNTLMWFCLWK